MTPANVPATPSLKTLVSKCGDPIERPEVVTRMVSRLTGLSERRSMAVYRALLSVTADALRSGQAVEWDGLGTFEVRDVPEHDRYDLQSGAMRRVPAGRKLVLSSRLNLNSNESAPE